MSPGNWVAIVIGLLLLCWFVAYLDEVANGTPEERAARANADMEAMLKQVNQEVTDRPRVRAGTTFFNRENT